MNDHARLIVLAGWLVCLPAAAAEPLLQRLPPAGPRSGATVWEAAPPATARLASRAAPPLGDGAGAERAEPLLETDPLWLPEGSWIDPAAGPGDEGCAPSARPPGAKPGILQRLSFQSTWLGPGGARGLGMHDLGAAVTAGFPFFTIESPLLLTPGFTAHFLEGPSFIDVPPRLYDATLDVRWLRKLGGPWAMDLAVTPGVYSDFEQSDDAFRLTGRGLGVYDARPNLKLVGGVAYLNRGNWKILPVGGLLWQPNDDLSWELIVPQPRVARRLRCQGPLEWWVYLGGEFGGGVWAVERADGSPDLLTLNDYRLRLGLERKVAQGIHSWFEAGYVFGRTLEYRSVGSDADLDDTFLLRAGAAY